jgi:benzoylformate decarboxylase
LTNALANGTPLVVTAGQQDERHLVVDPMLSGPLAEIAAPTVKWSHEVRSLGELGTIMRRAFADSAKSPSGPTFVSLRMDVLERAGPTDDVAPPQVSKVRSDATAAGVDELVRRLLDGPPGSTALVLADEVAAAGASDAARELAEAVGAPVFGSPLHAQPVFDVSHGLWRGMLHPSAAGIRRALGDYRRIVLLGSHAFLVYPYTPGSPVPPDAELIHIAPNAASIGRSHAVALGLVGGLRSTLLAAVDRIRELGAPAGCKEFLDAADRRRADQIEQGEAKALAGYGDVPVAPVVAAHALVRSLPDGVPIVEEAVTTGVHVREFHHRAHVDGYFSCRGGGLGWGMPAACGVSLGRDRAPVLCVVGDGSAMYSPQAIWTAAREHLPVVFAVVDNGQYRILKDFLKGMGGPSASSGTFVGMDLQPAVDFEALGSSMGATSLTTSNADDVGDAVREGLARDGPTVIRIPISGGAKG